MSKQVLANFSKGEIAEDLLGRIDVAQYSSALQKARNFIVRKYGGVTFRTGTRFMGFADDGARLIPFQYSVSQSYVMVMSDSAMRPAALGGFVIEEAKPITGVTNLPRARLVVEEHGWSEGDDIYISGVVGPSLLNGLFTKVYSVINANTIEIDFSTLGAQFYVSGGLVSKLYSAETPFVGVDLPTMDYAQSTNFIYFAHPLYPPSRATRSGHANWSFVPIEFGPENAPPTTVTATPTVVNTDDKLSNGDANQAAQYYPAHKYYRIASVSVSGQVSRPTAPISAVNDLGLKGNFNTISWTNVAGSEHFVIFASDNASGTYGYIGRSEATTFQDNDGGVAPDYSDGPRVAENPFSAENFYPRSVTFHQNRLFWGGTDAKPNGVWGSQVADTENMDRSAPLRADDSIETALVAEQVNAVQYMTSLKTLVALTSEGVFSISGANDSGNLTAISSRADRQTGLGCARLKPIVVDNIVFMTPRQGSSVRTLGYAFEADGYKTSDVSIFSPHFFEDYQIVDWAFQTAPYSCIWAVRDDGVLLCMTWEQEQQVWGWTQCDTDGFVQSVAVITEEKVDRLYLAIRRMVGGVERVCIERMALPLGRSRDSSLSCHLDCSISQTFDAQTLTVGGLHHLEGRTVTALADGFVVRDLVVEKGRVTLPHPAKVVTVGLPYSGYIETLPLILSDQRSSSHVERQQIKSATVRVKDTRGLAGGVVDGGPVYDLKMRTDEGLGEPIALKTGDMEVKFDGKWSNGARIRIEQTEPLPATISAIFIDPLVS